MLGKSANPINSIVFLFRSLNDQIDFIQRLYQKGFRPNNSGNQYKCEICKTDKAYLAKHHVIRHVLDLRSGHWMAVTKVGKEALGVSKEYQKLYDQLVGTKVVKDYLNNQEALTVAKKEKTEEEK